MARLVPHGKYLLDGAQKFYIRGVSYGPFAPNSRGERYPEPERAAADFALMKRLGANLIRLYVPPPPWMVEEAQKAGLRMMLGIPWPFHMAFLDSADMMREIRDAIRQTVLETRQFGETIAAYSIGNEIRSDIVRWHGPRAVSNFLAELRDLGKQIDPGRALHLLELSVRRISRFEFSRFHFVQRLSASRRRLPPLPDASDGTGGRAAAGAQRNRDGYDSRRRGASGGTAFVAVPRGIRARTVRLHRVRVHRRMAHRRRRDNRLGIRTDPSRSIARSSPSMRSAKSSAKIYRPRSRPLPKRPWW